MELPEGLNAVKDEKEIGLNDIILASLERGLSMEDIRSMQLGDLVDFCIDFNNRDRDSQAAAEHQKQVKHYRMATPAEIDAFLH